MPSIAPTVLFPGYSLLNAAAAAPAQGIFIPLSSLPGLTADEANTTTGDGRKLAYELARQIQSTFLSLPAAARPNRMNVIVGTPSGVTADIVRRSYTFTFDVSILSTDVAEEA